ncbi:MAG: DctP family TRAP transporter solute-binding subunit [Desulfobacter sp.]
MKRSLVKLGIAAVLTVIFAATPAFSKARVIKVSTTTQPTHIYNVGLEHFAKLVKEKTNGELEVQIFPAAQLGSERDAVEGLQLGTLEMTLTSTGPLGNFIPEIKLLNLPFLFKDRDEAYKILDGKIGTGIADKFPAIGIRSLGWYENGFRHITNNVRPINSMKDMAGIKIRVMEDSLFISTMKALGASPLPMAFGELYTALEQGTVDAQENPLVNIDASRFYEVQKHLAITGHFYSPAMLLVSEIFYQSLTPAQQKALAEAATLARDFERNLSIEGDKTTEAKLASKGMTVTHPDKAEFVKAVAPVYKAAAKDIGGGDAAKGQKLIDETLAELGR